MQLLTKSEVAFQLGFMSHRQVYQHPYDNEQTELIQCWISGFLTADAIDYINTVETKTSKFGDTK